MTLTLPVRPLAFGAAIATLAAAFVTLPAVTSLPVSDASAATAFCTTPVDTRYGNLHTAATVGQVLAGATETGVTAYIEGDFTALNGGQETEGQFVVEGDANFFTHTYTNIGVVGIGSQVSPVPGTDVLVTGGDINIGTGTPATTTVEVSHWSDGNIVAGGAINVGSGDSVTFNGGGGQTAGAASPLTPYASVPAAYNLMSTYYAAQTATGIITNSASDVTFTGDGTSAVQFFTAPSGSIFGTMGAPKKLSFVNIPADAVIIVTVTDTTATISTNQLVALNGVDADWSVAYAVDPTFSHFTQSLLWNFPAATDITFGNGSQIPGSIIAPNGDITLLASTNGRVYAGGNVELGDIAGTQSGLEMHNYGFRGFDCSTTGGSLAITKVLSDPSDIIDDSRVFTGTYTCVVIAGADVTGTWSVTAGATQTITGLPVGATCSIDEDALTTPPSATDTSYVWGTPTYSADQVIGDGTTVTITATNTFSQDAGSLAITKTLSDPSDIVDDTRVFTGTYSCDPTTGADITGTWSVTVGSTQTVNGIPAGAVCTITEDALTTGPSSDTSYVWGTPTYSPTSGTITTGDTVTITAQNSFTRETGSFAITKALSDPDSVVTVGRLFTGTYTCDPQSGADLTGTWSVTAGSTQTVTNVPVGSSCSITEDALTVAPSSTDATYVWDTPTFSATSVTTTTGTVTITATNTVLHGVGELTITKALTDADGVVDPTRLFTGTVSCTAGTPSPNTWSILAGATATFTDIPAGATCTVTEDALTVGPSSTDSSYFWQPISYTGNGVAIIEDDSVGVTVNNEVRRALGHLELIKVLDDPFNVVDLSRVYTGTFSCIQNSVDITPAPGTWSTTAGAAPITLATNLPAGTVCTVAEDAATLAAPPLAGFPQYIWRAPVITPATIVITDGVTGRFTVTNTVYDPFALLAHSGTETMLPLLLGGGAVTLGLVAVFFGKRRRKDVVRA